MTPSELFEMWAPPGQVWSPWVKPVLFAQAEELTGTFSPPKIPEDSPAWLDSLREDTAIVLDLPGPRAVSIGLRLAQLGYRPVPLFNTTRGIDAVLEVREIQERLLGGASVVVALDLRTGAPPVFLLDSERRDGHHAPTPGSFDNRWVVFPQDFPSAAKLRENGIRRVLVWQVRGLEPEEDLCHVLLRWQQAGIAILAKQAASAEAPVPIEVHRPAWYRTTLARLFVATGLRPNSAGGFGAKIPTPNDAGYG